MEMRSIQLVLDLLEAIDPGGDDSVALDARRGPAAS
jgi:hypothetical protein